jgi:hypothetical protein
MTNLAGLPEEASKGSVDLSLFPHFATRRAYRGGDHGHRRRICRKRADRGKPGGILPCSGTFSLTTQVVLESRGGTMRAIVIREGGGPKVLRLEEVPDPEPGEGRCSSASRWPPSTTST